MALYGQIAVVFLLLLAYLYYQRLKTHRALSALPQPKNWNPIFGNLQVLARHIALQDTKAGERHLNYAFETISKELGEPPFFYIDLGLRQMILVRDAEVLEGISKGTAQYPHALPKHGALNLLKAITGHQSIFTLEGPKWKKLRKRFNPGFQPSHINKMTSAILKKTEQFDSKLVNYSRTNEVFELEKPVVELTFDIIGIVALDEDLHAQEVDEKKSPLIKAFLGILGTYSGTLLLDYLPWERIPRAYYSHKVDKLIDALVTKKFNETTKESKALVNLSFAGIDRLTPALITETRDQLKTFLFAGHDTTAIALQWSYFLLFKHPSILAAVRAELSSIFGTGASDKTSELLAEHPEKSLNQMVLTTAVIKESLRLYPPAAGIRRALKGQGFTLRWDGKDICVDEVMLWLSNYSCQRSTKYWGPTATEFDPYRWIESSPTYQPVKPIAFRSFERGPRNCIGQELAMLEAKVILATTLQKYDFVKVGMDGVAETEVYATMRITARPVDRMKMRVRMNEKYRDIL